MTAASFGKKAPHAGVCSGLEDAAAARAAGARVKGTVLSMVGARETKLEAEGNTARAILSRVHPLGCRVDP